MSFNRSFYEEKNQEGEKWKKNQICISLRNDGGKLIKKFEGMGGSWW